MLRGEQVVLRPIQRDDLKRLYELQQNVDLVVLAFGAWFPFPLARMEERFDKNVAEEQTWFAIEVEGVVIGTTGLKDIERRDGTASVGISITDPAYLGEGHGRDALKALLDWGFRGQNFRRIWLDTLATNERAIRSYRACGFVEEGRLRKHFYFDGAYVDAVVMGILRSEWEARRLPESNAKTHPG